MTLSQGLERRLATSARALVLVTLYRFQQLLVTTRATGLSGIRHTPLGWCSGHEQLCMGLSNIQRLVDHEELSAPDNAWYVLCHVECGIRDCLKRFERHRVLMSGLWWITQ